MNIHMFLEFQDGLPSKVCTCPYELSSIKKTVRHGKQTTYMRNTFPFHSGSKNNLEKIIFGQFSCSYSSDHQKDVKLIKTDKSRNCLWPLHISLVFLQKSSPVSQTIF